MTTIVTRASKMYPLTFEEMDANFSNLNDDKLEAGFPASQVGNTPVGNISATDVQAAINELDTEKLAVGGPATSVANTPAGDISAVTVQAAINELDADKVPRTSTTGSAKLPVGTTAERDGSPGDGYIRYNTTTLQFEGYFNGAWQSVGGGQLLGNALVKGIFYNAITIAENLTVASGTNGMSAGPITIADGYTVTVSDGSVWSIV